MSVPLPAFYTPPGDLSADQDEQYVPLEAIAHRLGISSSILVRRVEAGDIPARRVQGGPSPRYELLLSDLGLEPEEDEAPPPPPPAALTPPPAPPPMPAPAPPMPVRAETPPAAEPAPPAAVPITPHFVATPPELGQSGNGHIPAHGEVVESRPAASVITPADGGALSDVSTAPIDPRELVAGLLDRWERSLEHRIYAEQQQRFESELAARQALLKELQMELQTARAEHAAAQADKDRALAERDRALADRDRELGSLRAAAAAPKRGRFFRR